MRCKKCSTPGHGRNVVRLNRATRGYTCVACDGDPAAIKARDAHEKATDTPREEMGAIMKNSGLGKLLRN